MTSKINFTALIVFIITLTDCVGPSKFNSVSNEKSNNNPLICDPETGVCIAPKDNTKDSSSKIEHAANNKVKLVYFTDPICSSCWGIEPQLRKLKLEYGNNIIIEYRMGGLLPDWSYNSGGISKPSDVAKHWDEVSVYYDMPIDGDLWLEDPLESSYPPSIAYKAAQIQDQDKADMFMREIREMVFLKKKNITKWEHLAEAGKNSGLDVVQLKSDFEGIAKTRFQEDLKLAREYSVRGFPSVFFLDSTGITEMVYGSKPYAYYETAILNIDPTIIKMEYSKNWETLFSKYHSLTAKEYSVLSGVPRNESEKLLTELTREGNLEVLTTKNGSLWTLRKTSN